MVSIMHFAVAFLKMLTLCMLWKAQFVKDLHAGFRVYQICIFRSWCDLHKQVCVYSWLAGRLAVRLARLKSKL